MVLANAGLESRVVLFLSGLNNRTFLYFTQFVDQGSSGERLHNELDAFQEELEAFLKEIFYSMVDDNYL